LKLWLDGLSDGLQTQIDERGRNLSQGEKQLLCMARCLLQDSPIVIMDEATSNVDPHSEEILVRATSDFFAERTQIIIAHRLSTIEKCDRILWLHNGEIKMLGKPSEVLPEFREAHL
jgi:ABC-type multidrug transport system fused ATPase/permease subunit